MPFLENGYEVEVVAKLPEGYVVRYIYEEDDQELRIHKFSGDEVFTVPKIYYKPLTHSQDSRVKILIGEIVYLEELKIKRQLEISNLERDVERRLAKLKKHKALERVEDFLDSKITHYVKNYYGRLSLSKFENEVSEGYNHSKHLRLLSLFGDSNGDLEWKLNQYSEGSGDSTLVYPACSLEEAIEILYKEYLIQLEKTKANPTADLIAIANEYSFSVPEAYLSLFKQKKLEGLKKAIQERKSSLKDLEVELKEIK